MTVNSWKLGGRKLEVISPPLNGSTTFIQKFAERYGDGRVHHITFIVGSKVEDLRRYRDLATNQGYTVVGYAEDPLDRNPKWHEFFLSPKKTGVLIQFAVFEGDFTKNSPSERMKRWEEMQPSCSRQDGRQCELMGVLIEQETVDELLGPVFCEVLGGTISEVGQDLKLVEFPNSQLQVFLRRGPKN